MKCVDNMRVCFLAVVAASFLLSAMPAAAGDSLLSAGQWKRNGLATRRFEIRGTENRNNPLRRKLPEAFSGDELFVRYRLRYDAGTIDTPAEGNGEFFVFWLDDTEGGVSSTHSGGIPNVGIHVSNGENRFMTRYGPSGEKFGEKLRGDRDYLVVARLWKSAPGRQEPFDQLDLWIDPQAGEEFSPDASARGTKAVSDVTWIGFSTGVKTEFEDRIELWDIELSKTWEGILGLPPKTDSVERSPAAERTVDFAADVFPLLESHCFACHQGEDATSGVRLDILDEVLNQTAPRDATESHLYQLVAQGDMPPEGQSLKEAELAILRAWIDEGLDWDESLLPTPVPQSDHWAFQPIRRPAIPEVKNGSWIRTPVDAFVARRHQQLGLTPAPEADAATLNRRLSLDLLGLPPSGTDGKARDIDELLANPAYGQRWARHWLDVARWAESNGHQHNRDRPHAWRYRDWVVNAMNDDKPFDDFLREQIAGDEITTARQDDLIATGFLSAARYSGNELDKKIQRNDILVDIANTTATAFLGLTLECAQCHSHKFDPISIRDYYRFQAFFAKGQPGNVVLNSGDETTRSLVAQRWRIFDSVHERLATIKRKQGHPEPIYIIPKAVIRGMRPDERSRFQKLDRKIRELPQTWGYYSPVTAARKPMVAPHDMRWPLPRSTEALRRVQPTILIRGAPEARGPDVQPGWPLLFGTTPRELDKPRTALAEWMTSPKNPLTSRVWVNRIWQWHFGRGIVETSGDFGTQGADPTHPGLLDFLARELIDSGWSTKHIHRLILESATYRQSSRFSPANAEIDPENKMLWRWTPRRLEAEAIRDSILAASGRLDSARGGPSVTVDSTRRSLYLKQRRGDLPDQQLLFDSAAGLVSCSRRRVSTTGLQPLWLMNSEFAQNAAENLAQRAGSVQEAMKLVIGRDPTADEADRLQKLATDFGLESACLAILNSSEFLYIP